MARILRTDGTTELTSDLSLENLQKIVGGYIEEIIPIDLPDSIMIVNEDGIAKNLPHNKAASAIADLVIVGDVVLCDRKELEELEEESEEDRISRLTCGRDANDIIRNLNDY